MISSGRVEEGEGTAGVGGVVMLWAGEVIGVLPLRRALYVTHEVGRCISAGLPYSGRELLVEISLVVLLVVIEAYEDLGASSSFLVWGE